MKTFREIEERAEGRKGGAAALAALMPDTAPLSRLADIPDDRWLAGMARSVFQSGFSWKVIEKKWPGFEEAFLGFDPHAVAFWPDEEVEALVHNTAIVRNMTKIKSVHHNARFVCDLAAEHGSAGAFFANWPVTDQTGLWAQLKTRGARLGGLTGQYFLRQMGYDGFVLGRDVVAALVDAGVVEKNPTSKRDLAAVQAAFNTWAEETGHGHARLSRTLGLSIDAD